MNIQIAQILADAVTIKLNIYGLFEPSSFIKTGVDLASNTQTACVVSENSDVIINWISATRDTVQAAENIVRSRIDIINDELDAQ